MELNKKSLCHNKYNFNIYDWIINKKLLFPFVNGKTE